MRGTVKWFNAKKGYGFITDSNGADVFVHQTQIQMGGFRTLNEGDIVDFEIGTTDTSNRTQAINVQPVITLNMVKRALHKDNYFLKERRDSLWMIVDKNNFIVAGDCIGLTLIETAKFAGINVSGLEG